jgi:Tfp pilus assembly protein PilO
MSYGLRNTLILLVVLTIFVGGGWSYLYFYQEPQIEELQGQVEQARSEYENKKQIADRYPTLLNRYEKATEFLNNFPKTLYPNSNEDNVYDFLNTVSSGSAYTDFTFTFSDSTVQGDYGIMNMEIAGEGYYRNFVNYIRQIELSTPVNKINNISVSPINQLESYGMVSFSFTIASYYDRAKVLGEPSTTVSNDILGSIYNPFYPLIRSIENNTENLIDIEQSTLLAVSGDRVFLLDQGGAMQKLRPGDEVYLGELTSINVNRGSATFVLNKGGIIDRITLQVNNDDENQSSN